MLRWAVAEVMALAPVRQEYELMADVPLLRAVSHSHHSQDGEFLDFTRQFADGSATKFEVPARFPLPPFGPPENGHVPNGRLRY